MRHLQIRKHPLLTDPALVARKYPARRLAVPVRAPTSSQATLPFTLAPEILTGRQPQRPAHGQSDCHTHTCPHGGCNLNGQSQPDGDGSQQATSSSVAFAGRAVYATNPLRKPVALLLLPSSCGLLAKAPRPRVRSPVRRHGAGYSPGPAGIHPPHSRTEALSH